MNSKKNRCETLRKLTTTIKFAENSKFQKDKIYFIRVNFGTEFNSTDVEKSPRNMKNCKNRIEKFAEDSKIDVRITNKFYLKKRSNSL